MGNRKIVGSRLDLRVSAHYFQARILWLQGHADQALRVVAHNIKEADSVGQPLSFCSVLGQAACPIAFWAGDLEAAARYGAMLLDHTERHPVRLWNIWARCFIGLVTAAHGDVAGGLQALSDGLEQAGEARFLPRFLFLQGEQARLLGETGEIELPLQWVEQMLARCEARDERWYMAELQRIKAELILAQRDQDTFGNVEALFLSSLDEARRQDALSWELRTALSLARFWKERQRSAEAGMLLRPIYSRFTEGFETADLRMAKALLEELPRAIGESGFRSLSSSRRQWLDPHGGKPAVTVMAGLVPAISSGRVPRPMAGSSQVKPDDESDTKCEPGFLLGAKRPQGRLGVISIAVRNGMEIASLRSQ